MKIEVGNIRMKEQKITYLCQITMEPPLLHFLSTPPLHYPSQLSEDEVSLHLPRITLCESSLPTFSDYFDVGQRTSLPPIDAYTNTPEPKVYMHPDRGTEVNQTVPEVPDMTHPSPPFFHVDDLPGHPVFEALVNGELCRFPYVRYYEHGLGVLQLGTDGMGQQPSHGKSLLAPLPSMNDIGTIPRKTLSCWHKT